MPGFEHVGVAVVQDGGAVTTMASTGRLVREMDSLQYELDQGPCLDALRQERLVLVEDLPHQTDNWPLYAPRASQAGVRAQMGVRLHNKDGTLGGLNFYSTAAVTIDRGTPHRAQLIAANATMALSHARYVVPVSEVIATRQLIGQAVGVLMERLGITEDQAMYYLVRVASAGRVELHQLAREVVDQGNRRARRPLPDRPSHRQS